MCIRSRIISVCVMIIAVAMFVCSETEPSERPYPVDCYVCRIMKDNTLCVPKTMGKLEDLSAVIVKGSLLDDAKQKLHFPEVGVVGDGVTVSSFEISKVYKGNLQIRDKISIAESYYTFTENGTQTCYAQGYAPSVAGQKYIFFLTKSPEDNEFLRGTYSPMAKEIGRYPVIDTKDSNRPDIRSMTERDLNLVNTDLSLYQEMYQKIIDKYMKE